MTRVFIAFVLGVFVTFGQPAHADKTDEATAFVNNLFLDFQNIFSNKAKDYDIDQAFLDYYDQHFDNLRISRIVIGNWLRRMNKEQIKNFSTILPKFLCRQIAPHINKYFSTEDSTTKVKFLRVKEMKKNRLQIDMQYEGLQKLRIRIVVTPLEDGFQILDVKIADISMLLAQRDQISQMILDHSGDINSFLAHLHEKSRARCIEAVEMS